MPDPTRLPLPTAAALEQPHSPLRPAEAFNTTADVGGFCGVEIIEQAAQTWLLVIARRERSVEVTRVLKDLLGLEMPSTPRHAVGPSNIEVLWSGPSQWLLLIGSGNSPDLTCKIQLALSGLASVVDQSSAYVTCAISGSQVRRTLEKLVGIDVDGKTFPVRAAAMTVIAHIPVYIWRVADHDGHASFRISAPQSYAASFWHHIAVAAAEYGVDARPLIGQ